MVPSGTLRPPSAPTKGIIKRKHLFPVSLTIAGDGCFSAGKTLDLHSLHIHLSPTAGTSCCDKGQWLLILDTLDPLGCFVAGQPQDFLTHKVPAVQRKAKQDPGQAPGFPYGACSKRSSLLCMVMNWSNYFHPYAGVLYQIQVQPFSWLLLSTYVSC